MKILLSPHMDTVKHPYKFEYSEGIHKGLLDNTIGVLATYLALYGNETILEMSAKGEIGVWHNWNEEFGILKDEPKINQDTIVICVDITSGEKYEGIDFAIENVSGISEEIVREIDDNLSWEGFHLTTRMYDGLPEDEDEAWQWKNKGKKVLSFIIPIVSPNNNWHGEESTITHRRLKRAVQGLQRLICYLT